MKLPRVLIDGYIHGFLRWSCLHLYGSWVYVGLACCGSPVTVCVCLPPPLQFEKVRELMQGTQSTHSRGAINPASVPGMHTGMVSGHRGLILPSESHFHGEQSLITVRDSGPNSEVYTVRT